MPQLPPLPSLSADGRAPTQASQRFGWPLLLAFAPLYLANLALADALYLDVIDRAAFWPAVSVFTATLVLLERRWWIPAALLAAVCSTAYDAVAVLPGPPAVGVAGPLESLLAAHLFLALGGVAGPATAVAWQFMATVVPTTFVGAAVAAAEALFLDASTPFMDLLVDWWLSRLLGEMIVFPAIIAVVAALARRRLTSRVRSREALLFVLVVETASLLVFGQPPSSEGAVLNPAYLMFPLFMWGAMRIGQPPLSVAASTIALAAVGFAGTGRGPFVLAAGPTIEVHVEVLQLFILSLLMATSLLASAALERSRESKKREAALTDALRSENLVAMGRVAAAAAHDFNNYLLVIDASLQSLELDASDDETRAVVSDMKTAARNSIALVDEMRAFAPRDGDARGVCHVSAALTHHRSMLERMLGPRIELVVTDLSDDASVSLSEDSFARLLTNFASNTRDAIGDAAGTFRLEVRGGPDRVEMVVADDGPGVPAAAAAAHLFEPFFSTKGERGTGLGLAATRTAVVVAGGSIELLPARAGAAFRVALPRVDVG